MKPYSIIAPNIPTGQIYRFTTAFDVEYEVRFGRKKDNILHAVVVFGVLNEEYEGEEYIVTNKGDAFRVMTTIAEIILMYFKQHPNTQFFEFTGILREDDNEEHISQRTKLYMRYLPYCFPKTEWLHDITINRILVSKIGAKI